MASQQVYWLIPPPPGLMGHPGVGKGHPGVVMHGMRTDGQSGEGQNGDG